MSKIDLSRRQFVNVTAAAGGLFAMSSYSNLVLGEEPRDVGLQKILKEGDSRVPYIGITEDGPLYPPVEIPWLKRPDFCRRAWTIPNWGATLSVWSDTRCEGQADRRSSG